MGVKVLDEVRQAQLDAAAQPGGVTVNGQQTRGHQPGRVQGVHVAGPRLAASTSTSSSSSMPVEAQARSVACRPESDTELDGVAVDDVEYAAQVGWT